MEKLPIRVNLTLGSQDTLYLPFVVRRYDVDVWYIEAELNFENTAYTIEDVTSATLTVRNQTGASYTPSTGTVAEVEEEDVDENGNAKTTKRVIITFPFSDGWVQAVQTLVFRLEVTLNDGSRFSTQDFILGVYEALFKNAQYIKNAAFIQDTDGNDILTPDSKYGIVSDDWRYFDFVFKQKDAFYLLDFDGNAILSTDGNPILIDEFDYVVSI